MSVAAVLAEIERAPLAAMPPWRKLAIFFVMAVGQFMALLDIQIVVASMGSIQAGLSASLDEIDWIQTAYLMAEIVMIPLSAYLAQALSTRWVFVGSAALFTLTSLFCGVAWDLPSMVAFRALQGFVGGAMIPLAFATGFTFFDGAEAATATAVLGVMSTLAPTLGPAIGGWITEVLGWRWSASAGSRRPSRSCCSGSTGCTPPVLQASWEGYSMCSRRARGGSGSRTAASRRWPGSPACRAWCSSSAVSSPRARW